MFCGLMESFCFITKESVGMGNKDGRNTICFGKIIVESVWKIKQESGV